ncbi:glycosyltransferase family 2 protein [Roseomonas sp. JC162]|uniref:Glycosyltransferase family 2 protein n=1 Tax=Neoroseomonas marina TaxID=1232220 RepID=A0A848EJ51_9PROT|nr:glycosyltransferase [Neoroseomonas marina]NMJ43413.1 glycosyltransferase family 2 protein [Neoroseomonas marina]
MPRLALTPGGIMLLDLPLAGPLPAGATALTVAGRPLPPPSASLLLGSPQAPRLIHAARQVMQAAAGHEAILHIGGERLGAFLLSEPLNPAAFAQGFAGADRDAVLRFLAVTCATMLRASADPGLSALCRALVDAADPAPCLAAPSNGLSAWLVPQAPDGVWRLLSDDALRRAGRPTGRVMLLDAAHDADAILLPPAPARPVRLDARKGAATLSTLTRDAIAGRRRAPALLRALATRAVNDARAASVLREAQLLAPSRPTRVADPTRPIGAGLDLALSDHAGGVFLCGWLRDPLGLIASLELRAPGRSLPLAAAGLNRVPRPDILRRFATAPFGQADDRPGFVAYLPGADPAGTAQWRLAARLTGGTEVEVAAPPGLMPPHVARDLVLRAVHASAVTPALLDDCIGPAAAALHVAARRSATGTAEVVALGPQRRSRPRASLVVPLYRNLRFLRFQLAAFARDEETRRADLIYVLDSPEQRHEVEHLLRGMAAMHGLPLRLVVMPRNGGYAAACNAGAAEALAPALLFLNSDVLPAAPGWLGVMLARLGRDRRLAAVGPRLLFDEGSIQHAGLFFRRGEDGVWLNDHYCKGFPRRHPDALTARRVPAITGAALLVRRAAFERVAGFCTDYIVGDFEDSDLCLKLRTQGDEIAYEPDAELFHFERQSIALHDGHARTLAGAINRRLHHRRWDGAIAALMARHGAG